MKMYAKYKTDPVAEQEGTDVEFVDGLTIRVRSMRSKIVRDMQAKINKRNQRFHRTGATIPTDVQDADSIDVACVIITKWDGATDENGAPLPFSAAAVRKVMTDLPELREQVIGAAALSETFRAEELKASTENLSTASAASSASPVPEAQ